MDISIRYDEIIGLIRDSRKVKIDIRPVSEHTACVSCAVYGYLPPVKINVSVEYVSSREIHLAYSSSFVTAMIADVLMKYVERKVSHPAVEFHTGERFVCIHLDKMFSVSSVWERVSVCDICFRDEELEVMCSVR